MSESGTTKVEPIEFRGCTYMYLSAPTLHYNCGLVVRGGNIVSHFAMPKPPTCTLDDLKEEMPNAENASEIDIPKLGKVLVAPLPDPMPIEEYLRRVEGWNSVRARYIDAQTDSLTSAGMEAAREWLESRHGKEHIRQLNELAIHSAQAVYERMRDALDEKMEEEWQVGANHDGGMFFLHFPQMTEALKTFIHPKERSGDFK